MSIFVPGVESNSILYTSYRSQYDDSLTSYERMHQSAVAYRDFELFMSKQCAVLNIGLDGCSNIARMVDYLNNSGSVSTVAQLYDLRLYTADGSDYIVGTEGLGDMLAKAWEFIVTTIKKIIGFVGKLFGLSSKSVEDTQRLVAEDSKKLDKINEETAKEMQQMPEGETPKGFLTRIMGYITGGKAETTEEAIKAAQEARVTKARQKAAMKASENLRYYGKKVYDEIKVYHGNIGSVLKSYLAEVVNSINQTAFGNYGGKDRTDASRYEEAGNRINQNAKSLHQGVGIEARGGTRFEADLASKLGANVFDLNNLIKDSHESSKELISPFARYDLKFIKSAFADVKSILDYLNANPLSTVSDMLTNSLKDLEEQIDKLIKDMKGHVDEKSRESAHKSLTEAKESVSELSKTVSYCKELVTGVLEIVRNDADLCHTILRDMQEYQGLRIKYITRAKDLIFFRKE